MLTPPRMLLKITRLISNGTNNPEMMNLLERSDRAVMRKFVSIYITFTFILI